MLLLKSVARDGHFWSFTDARCGKPLWIRVKQRSWTIAKTKVWPGMATSDLPSSGKQKDASKQRSSGDHGRSQRQKRGRGWPLPAFAVREADGPSRTWARQRSGMMALKCRSATPNRYNRKSVRAAGFEATVMA